jgi:hypothetical protein
MNKVDLPVSSLPGCGSSYNVWNFWAEIKRRMDKMETGISRIEKINPEISRIEKMEAEMSKIEKIEAVVSKIEKKIDVLWPQYPEIP